MKFCPPFLLTWISNFIYKHSYSKLEGVPPSLSSNFKFLRSSETQIPRTQLESKLYKGSAGDYRAREGTDRTEWGFSWWLNTEKNHPRKRKAAWADEGGIPHTSKATMRRKQKMRIKISEQKKITPLVIKIYHEAE